MKLRDLIFGRPNKLRVYEQTIIDRYLEQLPSDQAVVLTEQLACLETVQRWSQDKLVVFFFRQTEASESPMPLVGNRPAEKEVRAARLRVRGANAGIRCDIVFYEGRLSTLEFNSPPARSLSSACEIESIRLLADLNDEGATPPQAQVATPILAALKGLLNMRDISAPPSHSALAAFLEWLGPGIPEDYVALLRETDGFSCGTWRFCGTSARRIVWSDANYVLVVEREDSGAALVLREDDPGSGVAYMDEINEHVKQLPGSFVDVLASTVVQGNADSRGT